MTDPLAAAESVAASKRFPKTLFIDIMIPVIVALLLGRIFCSWICPMNLLLEWADKLRKVLRFLELSPRDIRFARVTKYVLLARKNHTLSGPEVEAGCRVLEPCFWGFSKRIRRACLSSRNSSPFPQWRRPAGHVRLGVLYAAQQRIGSPMRLRQACRNTSR